MTVMDAIQKRLESNYEVFVASDGYKSIRPRGSTEDLLEESRQDVETLISVIRCMESSLDYLDKEAEAYGESARTGVTHATLVMRNLLKVTLEHDED